MRKLLLLTSYFAIVPLLLIFSSIALLSLSYAKNPSSQNLFSFFSPQQTVVYAALPSEQELFSQHINAKDGRIAIVRDFFAKYDSPLTPFAEDVVTAADKYHLDYRLLPAIAMQESNLCRKMPAGSNNCWGFGIYGGKITQFDDFHQAIEIVTKTLAHHYKGQGLETPDEIMSKYTPGSNGSWAFGVNYFMDHME